MFKYLDVHKQEQEEKNSFLPTVQLKLKHRNIFSMNGAYFINELIKDFYERPELFEDKDFKARKSLLEISKVMEEHMGYFYKEEKDILKKLKRLSSTYEYFKKKKYIKIETAEGKIPRGSKIVESYVVLTPLGIEEFLNLNKEDLSSKLDPFVEKFLDEYSFVLEENREYIKKDSEKIRVVLSELFKKIKPLLEQKYRRHYMNFVKDAENYIELDKEERKKYDKRMRGTESQYFLNKILRYDRSTDSYNMRYTGDELNEYINKVCDIRVEEDEREFVRKNSLKIAGAIKNRGYEIEGSINEDLESSLDIVLSDGAKFNVKTQIVGVENQYGTFFFRKPTTFHNVYLSNGEKLKTPSYEKVIKEL